MFTNEDYINIAKYMKLETLFKGTPIKASTIHMRWKRNPNRYLRTDEIEILLSKLRSIGFEYTPISQRNKNKV